MNTLALGTSATAKVLAVLAALAVAGLAYATWHGRYAAGYAAGVAAGTASERLVHTQAENQHLAQANARILALEESARQAEQEHAERLAALATHHQQELTRVRQTARTTLSDLDRGTLRLRDPGTPHRGPRAGADCAAETGPATGSGDGPAPGELSAATARFLVELVNDADETAIQLDACQAVIRADRASKDPAPAANLVTPKLSQ